jgi:uncharacterized protein (UPF0332 family)
MKKEGKIELVEPSEEICKSYLRKADDCLKSAKLLLQNSLYENSISMAYYAMYNSLIALFFRVGIKCENHSASLILFKRLFNRNDLFGIISFAKKERIDKQYYVTTEKDILTKESAEDMYKKAENFLIQIKILINELHTENIEKIRKKFASLFED